MIKEAADRLLAKGEISQDEYNALESKGLLTKEAAIDLGKILYNVGDDLSKITGAAKSVTGAVNDTLKFFGGEQAAKKGLLGILNKSQPTAKDKIIDGLRTYGTTLAAGGLALSLAKENIVDPASDKIKMGLTYKKMVESVDGLEDNDQTRDFFNVVATYSPAAAKNHIVAGSLVKRMNEFQGIDPNMVNVLGGINKNQPTKDGIGKKLISDTAKSLILPIGDA